MMVAEKAIISLEGAGKVAASLEGTGKAIVSLGGGQKWSWLRGWRLGSPVSRLGV